MAGVAMNEGEVILLEAAVGKTAAAATKLKLFTNNHTPDGDDTTADYTEMGAVQGYAALSLTTAGWNAATPGTGTATPGTTPTSITYPQQTFTADGTGGSVTVYGYYITNNAGTKMICAEKFSASQTLVNSGDFIKVTPTLKFDRG